jgi:hypothetical protein
VKLATVFNKLGNQVLRNRDGPVVFPVFRWWMKFQDENGWVIHLLAFCSATTEDHKFQMFQGIVAFGWINGPVLEFSPGIRVFRLGKE